MNKDQTLEYDFYLGIWDFWPIPTQEICLECDIHNCLSCRHIAYDGSPL